MSALPASLVPPSGAAVLPFPERRSRRQEEEDGWAALMSATGLPVELAAEPPRPAARLLRLVTD